MRRGTSGITPLRADALTPALSHRERELIRKKATEVAFVLASVRADALTPALSHRERELIRKKATEVAFLFWLLCRLMPSPQPSTTGRGS